MTDLIKLSEHQATVEHFQKWLNLHPSKDDIKQNKFADNSEYIPIGIIENKLDETYSGLWSVVGVKTERIDNSIVVQLQLRVYHPVAKCWLTRYGVGAVPVQLNKGEKILSPESIKSDAYKKGVGAAKSYALRNAAQSLGVIFGRNLNRADVDEYEPLTEQANRYSEAKAEALELLESKKSTIAQSVYDGMIAKVAKGDLQTIENIIKHLS